MNLVISRFTRKLHASKYIVNEFKAIGTSYFKDACISHILYYI